MGCGLPRLPEVTGIRDDRSETPHVQEITTGVRNHHRCEKSPQVREITTGVRNQGCGLSGHSGQNRLRTREFRHSVTGYLKSEHLFRRLQGAGLGVINISGGYRLGGSMNAMKGVRAGWFCRATLISSVKSTTFRHIWTKRPFRLRLKNSLSL